MKELKEQYYIVFNNCEGSVPQKFTESFDYNKVKAEVDKLNEDCNEYCSYSVGKRQVYVSNRRKK